MKIPDELFPSTPGKFKVDRAHNMNRQLHRCFASTSIMFLWALFLIALTASYLSFQSFVDSGSRYFTASWGGIQWEKQVRNSAQIHRSGGMTVLVTGAAGDLNDAKLLAKLFDVVAFAHVMHLAAQAGVRYAMENPNSYVHSNIAGLVTLLETCKSANPQPAIVWASSSSVYGLNEKSSFL
ncbi:hypothetical protein CRYUN_Cryun33cG0025000 [Craigia yunnanensis]